MQNDHGAALALAGDNPRRVARLVVSSCEAFENYPPGLPGKSLRLAATVPGGLFVAMQAMQLPAVRSSGSGRFGQPAEAERRAASLTAIGYLHRTRSTAFAAGQAGSHGQPQMISDGNRVIGGDGGQFGEVRHDLALRLLSATKPRSLHRARQKPAIRASWAGEALCAGMRRLTQGIGDYGTVSDARCEVRRATAGDRDAVAGLTAELAQSFTFSRAQFHLSYPALLAADGACLLVAADGRERLGYLLGFRHLTFYANGPVAWVEEVVVRRQDRGRGVGRALMSAFEQWAAGQDCILIALATRRAAPFYRALGYEESAVYFRKVLEDQAKE